MHSRIILSTIEGTIKLISGLILSTIGGTIEGIIQFKCCSILRTIGSTIDS